ncbi:unnamed protein product [Cyclocybe aegerita]|uniref:RING-type domain-containing protein n=1 Tax=Cyclocybe aegerita TaxID=1973307 RepID=A0A8S0XL88_CYCAE|nr:unnamed protein product [Cyclocybe aegerita]
MGNSSSSSGRGHHDDTVDYGSLVPQGVYTGPRDWNQPVVSQLIVARRLAPFYRPLEDYDDSWDDDQILAARKELPDPDSADTVTRIEATAMASSSSKSKRPGSLKEPVKPEAQVYRGAVECPICFLYYPPNINHSRCCDQAICTECFVQIKRNEPTATHLVSEYAACPYCVQENFGVVYTPPPWRAGLGSDGANGIWSEQREPAAVPTHKRRQKSFGADSPEVVTTDQIRPDWEAKLEAVRAAVARRANRRIIMRQVGDRLIPVGITSGRVHTLSPEEAAAAGAAVEGSSGRRGRRRGQQNGAFDQYVGMSGQDLEELMLMEAMRLSLLDHEEYQRKEAEEKKKREAAEAAAAAGEGSDRAPAVPAEAECTDHSAPGPGPSTLEARATLHPSSSSNLSTPPSSHSRSPSPAAQRHNKVDSQDSLSPGRKSWSFSRSRTPPPPPNPVPNLPLSEDNQAAWRNRSAGPPAFSTLSAALTSTSTAAAVLGTAERGSSRSVTPEPVPASSTTSSSTSAAPPAAAGAQNTADVPIPTITVVNNDPRNGGRATPGGVAQPASSQSSEDSADSSLSSPPLPPLPTELARWAAPGSSEASGALVTSSGSGEQSGQTGYGQFPSSPESSPELVDLHEHLLAHSDSGSSTKVDDDGRAGAATYVPEMTR